jgi:hypothetical protein
LNVLGLSLCQPFTVINDYHTFTDPHNYFHVMFDQQNRDAFVPYATDQVHKIAGFLGVHSGGRFIKHKQARLGSQSPGDLEAALVTIRQGTGDFFTAALEPGELEELVGTFGNLLFFCLLELVPDYGTEKERPGSTMTTYLDIIDHCQVVKEPDILKCSGDPQGSDRLRLLTADGDGAATVGKQNLTLSRLLNTGNAIKKRRLPGTIRPNKADDFASIYVKGDII